MATGAASLSEALASGFLTCPICLERLCRPKILPCLHTFCQACLEQLAGRDGGRELRCPECRELVALPGPMGVEGLRNNFFVNGLLDLIRPADKTAPACSLCALVDHEGGGGPTEAEAHCLDCADHLCRSCARGHRCSRLTHAHRVVDMEGYLAGRFDDEIWQRRALRCKEHPEEELRFFCSPCAAALCRECRLGAHLQHACLPLPAAAAARRPVVEGLLRGVEETVQRLAEGRARLARDVAELRAREAALRAEAEAAGARLLDQLLAEQGEALTRLSAWVQERDKAAEGLRAELEFQEQVASSTAAFARRVLGLGCPAELLSLEEMISERLRQLQAFSWQPLAFPLPQLEVLNSTGEGGRFFHLELGGEAGATRSQRRSPGAEAGAAAGKRKPLPPPPLPPSEEAIAQESRSAGGAEDAPCPPHREPKGPLLAPQPLFSCSFWVKTPCDKKRPQVTGLCPFGSGQLLVADERNQRLKRFTVQGQFKGTVPVPSGAAPFSVAALGSKVAFTSGSQLYLLDGEGGLVWQRALPQGQASHALAGFGGNRLAVSVAGRLEVYDLEGRLVEKIVPRGSAERSLVFLASRKGGFVGADWYRHSVVLFTKKGELVAELPEEQLSNCQPGAVCADPAGIVYVVLRELNRVVAFSNDGEGLGAFLTAENSIDRPRVATVTGDGRFAVALSNGTIHVFKIRYQAK